VGRIRYAFQLNASVRSASGQDTIRIPVERICKIGGTSTLTMNRLASGKFKDVMSMRLVRALEDIGVNKFIVGRRRYAFLSDESVESVGIALHALVVYHFGSMSEGTTTPGMGSDIDTLHCNDDVNVINGWPEWKRGRTNLLMVKHVTCSPQHYRLQIADSDFPRPLTVATDEFCIPDENGTFSLSNTLVEVTFRRIYTKCNLPYRRTGPSHSHSEMYDNVFAYRCRKLPAECESWLTRERYGDWPTPDMLQAARDLGCFLISDGYCYSVHSSVEWRISPSLIERHLMFSMDMIHVQCYVALKLLKKDIIKPYLNESGKLTSFHCKTALFYAREQLPSSMWRDECLFDCIIYCLNLLRCWSIKGHCPHYIMDTVNLFDGKMDREGRQNLNDILTIIMDSHLAPLASIDTDHLGARLLHNVYTVAIWDLTPRRVVHQQITEFLSVISISKKLKLVRTILNAADDCSPDEMCLRLNSWITQLPLQQLNRTCSEQRLSRLDVVNRDFTVRYLCQHLASTAASTCIQHGMPIGTRIWTWYSMSMTTDATSSRLKLVSMFYCKGDLQLAADVLEDVQRRYDDRVQAMCGCGRMNALTTQPKAAFAETLNDETDILGTNKVAFCVRFLRHEAFCAPPVLHFEMIREVGNDIQHRDVGDDIQHREIGDDIQHVTERMWMKWAVVDSRPFLHYLQYLTFRGLGVRQRQLHALLELQHCTRDGVGQNQLFHPETAANLLAHCWEMEHRPALAVCAYRSSLEKCPRNNAANIHIHRLTGEQ